jgi:hypothetical protein
VATHTQNLRREGRGAIAVKEKKILLVSKKIKTKQFLHTLMNLTLKYISINFATLYQML